MMGIEEKLRNSNIPPHILRQLGLKKDWYKKLSSVFIDRVLGTANKRSAMLKELSKQ